MPTNYRLRTTMVLAAIPLLSAAAWYAVAGDEDKGSGKITIDSATSDKVIRQQLLERTPLGTSGVEVFAFAVNTLRLTRPINAYSKYVRAYEASTGKTFNVTPISAKTVAVTVAERRVGLLSSERVWAKWHFDEYDRLTDITMERMTIGP